MASVNKVVMASSVHTSVWSRRVVDVRQLLLAIAVCLFLVRGLVYLALIPLWQAPDEPTSVELLLTMQERGRLVSARDLDPALEQRIIRSMEDQDFWKYGLGNKPTRPDASFEDIWPGRTQLHRAPLYHLLLLPAAQLTVDLSLEDRLYIFHLVSLALVSVTVAVAVLVGSTFVDDIPALPLVVAALAALHPQLTIIGVSVNSDNLAGVIGALVFWVLLSMMRSGFSWLKAGAIGVLIGMGFWTKGTTMFLLPTALFGAVQPFRAYWAQLHRHQRRRLFVAAAGGIAGLLMLVLALPLGATLLKLANNYLFDSAIRWRLFVLFEYLRQPPFAVWPWFRSNVLFLNRTFWADVGWHSAVLPAPLAQLLLTITIVAWAMALVVYVVRRSRLQRWQRQFIATCTVGVILVVLQTLLRYLIAPTEVALAQGRYLFPAFVPIMFLIAFGLSGLWPRSWSRWLTPLVILLYASFDLFVLFGMVVPRFYA